ncbi:hypothetical protein [Gemmatimonas sp.]|jgi:hypothetical protein|uniref:hypothetical protein n=1 Tax=Gemmatimonas sp. TaxID=1962908 RepID=UPI0037C09C9D
MHSPLTVASHVLGLRAHLERGEGRGATTDELAESVGTDAIGSAPDTAAPTTALRQIA